MSSPYGPVEIPQELNEADMGKCFIVSHIKAEVLLSPLEEGDDDDDEEEEEESDISHSEKLVVLNVCDNNLDILCQMLYENALGCSYIENYKMVNER